MATIHNSDLFKELRDGAKNQQLRDGVLPTQLAEKVVPVMEVNPKLLYPSKPFAVLATLSNQTQATIYTCHAIKETYLTAASISYDKDVTSTCLQVIMSIVDEFGITGNVFRIATTSLTVQNGNLSMNFPSPLKLKKGSNILLTSTSNTPNIRVMATLMGYEIDNSLA